MNRCSLCPHSRSPVPSTGPTPARILFIDESPSYDEDRYHEPIRGKAGIEFDGTYLTILGLPRSMVHITHAIACSNRGYTPPTPAQAMSCSATHLSSLLQEVKPEIIVPMGPVSCSLFPEIESLALQHGRALPGKWGSWSGILFPMFRASSGLRATGYMIAMMQDMDDLRKLLHSLDCGEFEWLEDPYPTPDYQFIRTETDLANYLLPLLWNHGNRVNGKIVLGEDTESLPGGIGQMGGGSPFCLTFSHSPGTGRLIYTRDKHLIEAYPSRALQRRCPLR